MKPKRIALLIMMMFSFAVFGLWFITNPTTPATADEPVSAPGNYSGYSPVLYDGYKIFSQYVPVRDGTKLAADIIRPTLNGAVVETKLPVVWMHTPYNRRYYGSRLAAELYPGAALALVKYGYVVATVDKRGFYASYGTSYSGDGWDAYDIMEWLAAQPWSTGKIGMWGCSATGGTQLSAANLMPPSLKAIFPMSSGMGSGISFDPSLPPEIPRYPSATDEPGSIPSNDQYAVPVDEDTDESLLAVAKEEHRYNYLATVAAPIAPGGLEVPSVIQLALSYTQLIQSKVAMYHAINWDDLMGGPLATVLRYNNLTNPAKLILGAGTHCIWCTEYSVKAYPLDFNITVEERRFFDYWLKGIDNGVMDEPPVYYYTLNGTQGSTDWRFSWQWPVPQAKTTNFYLGAGPSGLGYGVNDGTLSTTPPVTAGAKDVYTTDYDIPIEMPYVGMVTIITEPLQATKGLTYTTEPLTADMELTGHPVVHLWISSTATDGDVWIDIEDLDETGKATTIIPASGSPNTTITAGKPLPFGLNAFRASYRALNTPAYNRLGLPYHRMAEEDIVPLTPGEPAELIFDLRPISYVVKAGHRLRVSITCVVGDSTPRLSPAPVVTFYRNPQYSSYISLPVVAPVAATARIVPGETTLAAHMTFPETMDSRYLSDIRMNSVKCNGIAAASTRMEGNTLIAVFSRSNLKEGQAMAVSGEFGNKYNYGNMTFAASGTVPTSSGSSSVCFIDTAGAGAKTRAFFERCWQVIAGFFH